MGEMITRGRDPKEVALIASKVLGRGGVIVYPTETIYGIGVDPFDPNALKRLYGLKGRDRAKPVSIAIGDVKDIPDYAEVSDACKRLIRMFLPGPLTLVLPVKDKRLRAIGGTIGIRIPQNRMALEIVRAFGPITSTSANPSGEPTPGDIRGIERMFGDRVDLYIEADEAPIGSPSTVLECMGASVRVLREGAISRQEIERAGVGIHG